jgi:hypothetical protein
VRTDRLPALRIEHFLQGKDLFSSPTISENEGIKATREKDQEYGNMLWTTTLAPPLDTALFYTNNVHPLDFKTLESSE